MNVKLLPILVFTAIASLTLNAQRAPSFKIVGYYPLDRAMTADTSQVPFNKLTHIMLAFINPDSSGKFNDDFTALTPFIKAAHNHHVKVLYSIGGGSYQGQYHAL